MRQSTIKVEVAGGSAAGPVDDHLANPVHNVVQRFADVPVESLVDAARDVIDVVARSFKPSVDGPESCAVKFGLKISAGGTVVIAQVGSELNLEVTVTWKR